MAHYVNYFANSWYSVIEPQWGVSLVSILAAVGILCGVTLWAMLYRSARDKGGFVRDIPRLISYIPSDNGSASKQIWAGVLVIGGVSVIIGILSATVFGSNASQRSFMSTNASLALAMLTLALVIWTLHQTKRLERLQGEPVKHFDNLVSRITRELDSLIDTWDANRDKSSGIFRVYILTNNPFFGINSYPSKAVTGDFKTAMRRLGERVATHRLQGKAEDQHEPNGFRIRIICADQTQMSVFNREYADLGIYTLRERDRLSEEFIAELERDFGAGCVVRLPIQVEKAQFVVVGDVVFEFLLEAHGDATAKARRSNIRHTMRYEDPAVADRFERYVRFIESLAVQGTARAVGPGGNGDRAASEEGARSNPPAVENDVATG